jgi:hypothetical protein
MAKAAKQQSNVVPLKNSPAEDAVKAVNLAKIKRANEALQEAKNNHQSVIKHAEAKGINLLAAKEALKIKKSGKTEEVVAKLTALLEYLFILGVPIEQRQLDLFRVEDPRAPIIERAKTHGRHVGIMGGGTDENPHGLETKAGQAWMEAFNGGTKERAAVMAMEPADGSDLIKGGGDDGGDGEEDEFDQADPNK